MEGEHDIDNLFAPLDDGPGPAPPLRAEQAEAAARAAVRRARGNRGKLVLPPWLQVAAAAALALLVGGGAMAAVAGYFAPRPEPRGETRGAATPPAPTKPRASQRASLPAPPREVAAPQPPPEVTPARTPTESRPMRARRASGGELLERANRLRAQGEFARAERLYAQVMRRSDEPDDAYVAMVAAAALRLEHAHSPREALALYRRALRMRPHGPLAASARYGIAQCHRALGDAEAETRALEELVASHPSHLMRSRAAARLRALAGAASR